MKKIFLITSLAFLVTSCCGPHEKKRYNFEIIYTNGDTTNQSYIGVGTNLFSLVNGDLTTRGKTKTLVSGVRSYRIISINPLGLQSDKEAKLFGHELQPVLNQE